MTCRLRLPSRKTLFAFVASSLLAVAPSARAQEPEEELVQAHLLLAGGRFDPVEAVADPRTEASLAADIVAVQQQVLDTLDEELQAGIRYLFRRQYTIWGSWTAEQLDQLRLNRQILQVEVLPQWIYHDPEAHPLTGVDTMQSHGFTGAGVVIAIIDSAIDHDHAAFGGDPNFPNAKILGGFDLADNDSDPTDDPGCAEDQGHGTAVAGVAAGNGGGVLGVAPDAKIVFYKVDSKDACEGPVIEASVAAGIDLAFAERLIYGTKIISMSIGTPYPNTSDVACAGEPGEAQAVATALAAGMILVASSGNEDRCDGIGSPACIDGVISVGAVADADLQFAGSTMVCTDKNGCLCVRSNSCVADALPAEPSGTCDPGYVPVDVEPTLDRDGILFFFNNGHNLDLLAPAQCARTAALGGGIQPCFGGTSAAAPFVSGLAAAVLESFGGPAGLDNAQMLQVLHNAAAEKYDWRVTPKDTSNGLYAKRRVNGEMAVFSPCIDCEGWTQQYFIPGIESYWPPVHNFFPFPGGNFYTASGVIQGWLLQHGVPPWEHPDFTLTLEKAYQSFPTVPPTYAWAPVAGGNTNFVSYTVQSSGTFRWKVSSTSTDGSLQFTLWSQH